MSDDTTKITGTSPVLDLDAEKPGPDASRRPQRLATVPYNPVPEREGVRTKLAIASASVIAGIRITLLFWALIWHNAVMPYWPAYLRRSSD